MPRAAISILTRHSLPDWAFHTAAVLTAGAMIAAALAMRPTGLTPTVTETAFIVEGEALGDLIPGPGTSVRFDPASSDGPVARARADASLQAAGAMSAGVAAIPPPEFEDRIAGRRLRIEMELRAASAAGPYSARIGYFTIGFGDSGWQEVGLSTEWSTASFEWTAPEDARANSNEAVGIWPDPEGLGREVVIRAIRVIILPDEA
jgi:hypothetical protein